MKVGVIVPVRNAKPWIEELSRSVQAQTHPTCLYLAEDWSDDGTYEFLLDRPDLYTAMARTESRAGWPAGLNAAAGVALDDGCDAVFTGSADDVLHPECIALCVAATEEGECDFVTPYAQQFGSAHQVQVSLPDMTIEDLAQWPLLIDKGLFTRKLWKTVGGYSLDVSLPGSFGCAEDWDFWIKVWKAGLTNYRVIGQPLYFMRVHRDQLSNDRGRYHAATVEIFRAKHPDVPWDHNSGRWPPRHRTSPRK